MRKVSRQLGRKWSEPRKKRHRENMARLKAQGVKFGADPDPRTRFEDRVCQYPPCGATFPFRIRPKTDPVKQGHYCKQNHAIKHVSWMRRKIPADFDLLYDLYITENMTTTEIGKLFDVHHGAVRRRLRDVGILPRKVGISRYTICVEKGCDKPIHRIQHKTNGSWYGKRCFEHWKAHRKRVCADYGKNNRPKLNAYQQKARAQKKQEIVTPPWVAQAIGL